MLRLCENASSSGLFCHQFVALPVLDDDWSPYDTAPDGQGFLVRATAGQTGESLTVIVNWPALLKKTTAAP